MAESASASAHVSPPPGSPETTSAQSLALQACDDIDSLHEVQHAFAGLEKLLVPQGVNDSEEVYPTRTELSALMRTINNDLRQRLEAAGSTVRLLRAAVGEDA
ncbi:hypothetical protein [Variovorax sp. W6]|uniref:hypothetical protein n=1 Tax=Variovorax sp. W6 TaxID=3093895 RepID=UPI003D806F5E